MSEQKFDKVRITKMIVRFIVKAGAARIVYQVIENNTPEEEKTVYKVTSAAGALVLGQMAGEAAGNYTDAYIDKFVKQWHDSERTINKTETTEEVVA